MQKFYFTYGTDSRYPFRGGWTLVYATDLQSAISIFRAHHPNREGSDCLNCADYYTAESFEKREIYKTGNFGAYCHETIGHKTNYEHIMAMSIDELVDFIFTETSHCDLCSRRDCQDCVDVEGGCKRYIKEYLESEVKT